MTSPTTSQQIAADVTALYECDCCEAKVPRDQIAIVIAYGIETAACDRCRGVEEGDAP